MFMLYNGRSIEWAKNTTAHSFRTSTQAYHTAYATHGPLHWFLGKVARFRKALTAYLRDLCKLNPPFHPRACLKPMRRVFILLQFLFSTARRALSLTRAVSPLIRTVLVTLKRFVRGCFSGFLPFAGVPTSSRLPKPHGTPQQCIQRPQAPNDCMPSFLPPSESEHHERQQEMPSLQHPVAPNITLHALPRPLLPEWFERYQRRRPVYVISPLC